MNDKGPSREAPRFYPWIVALTGMFALFLSNGMTATGITIFDPSLLDEFGHASPSGTFESFGETDHRHPRPQVRLHGVEGVGERR